jgi:hypothetical protein
VVVPHPAASPTDARALLLGGDWACAHCHPEGLATVAQQLGACVGEEERRALRGVARLVEIDMLAATVLWTRATRRLREQILGAPAP